MEREVAEGGEMSQHSIKVNSENSELKMEALCYLRTRSDRVDYWDLVLDQRTI
jgi:hypothetical protein